MDAITKFVRANGGRMSKIRKALIKILINAKCLISRQEILSKLKKQKINPNRSTFFREMLFLNANSIVSKNTISGVNYYEILQGHHHHLVCLDCSSIKKIDMEKHLVAQEKRIEKQNKFNILSHTLEFYGRCLACRQAGKKCNDSL